MATARVPPEWGVSLSRKFTIPGPPGIKQRPRWSNRNKRMMNPAANRKVEEHIRNHVIQQIPKAVKNMLPWHGPVLINVRFCFCIQKFRHDLHLVRPDLDNAVKSICDSLNGILWEDDSQVFDMYARKEYHRTQAFTVLQVICLEPR